LLFFIHFFSSERSSVSPFFHFYILRAHGDRLLAPDVLGLLVVLEDALWVNLHF
jgi:hypothetical protein